MTIDKKFEGMEFDQLVDLPIDALYGVSEDDAVALQRAFNIKTIGDLGRNKFVLAAVAMVALAGTKHKRDHMDIDVAREPELLRIAEAVRETGTARVLRRGTEEIAIVMPVSPRARRSRRDRPFTMNDPLWNVAGIGHSTGPTDIATNKRKYLAEAYAAESA